MPARPFYSKPGKLRLPEEGDLPGDFEQHRRRKVRRRHIFGISACLLFCIWLIGGEFIGKFTSSFKALCGGMENQFAPPGPHFPIPSGIELHECAEWETTSAQDEPHHPPPPHRTAFASFNLGLPSDLLFISRGSFSHGHFDLTQVEGDNDEVKVKLGVDFIHHHEHFLDFVKVCKISREDGSIGVGIFTPQWRRHPGPRPGPHPRFTVLVELPRSSGNEPLPIHSFETDLPLFSHFIAGEGVEFENLRLSTANEPITVTSVTGGKVVVRSVNAPIKGSFTTNSSITLETVNSPIHAHLNLYNEDSTFATTARITTTNSHIDASTNLTTGSDNRGNFVLGTSTVNGWIDVKVQDAPVDSILQLSAETVLAKINVHLHPTYEGEFSLDTVMAKASLDYKEDAEDPAGKGRRRHFDVNYVSPSHVKGSTRWGEGSGGGSVTLKTTLAGVNLHL